MNLSAHTCFCFQEFIVCIVPFIFHIGLDISQLSLSSLLLEEFITYYYSITSPALDAFLHHARQFRNSAAKLYAATILKRIIVLSKGLGFKYDPFEVMLLLEVISVCVLCAC